ncbi:DnaJ domain-containing protein [Methylobacterium sp. BTF04]|uniref:J domain-containing protein n=1 Tax=Methylobacterium sp. BTF04 TaxID=2708300 RepID=UPI0013D3C2D3|nr:DnaJ domain-containing protein [Methylobacterium sp. BTF04]NEU11603.1 DnaJ domain-containing protein [Methylobacterium sp. BTF04]
MTLLFGGLALLILWWGAGNARRHYPALTTRMMRQVGGYVALALAGLVLVRGRIDLALLLGAGGIWLLEGRSGFAQRWQRLIGRVRRGTAPRGVQTVQFGETGEGVALVGPFAGQALGLIPRPALLDLLRFCRDNDPDTARRLEAYLDRRHAGWRVDADADPDPRARRSADPGAMTQEQAYQILGLERGASLEEIRTAHRTLMKRLHPDQGGTVEQAARVNAARDRLTNRHR